MREKKYIKYITFLAVAVLLAVSTTPLFAQKKLQKSPGGYHGELDFPISWKRYYVLMGKGRILPRDGNTPPIIQAAYNSDVGLVFDQPADEESTFGEI